MADNRHALAENVLRVARKMQPDVDSLEADKAKLRAISAQSGEGFTETVEKLGEVEVKAGQDKKFKALVPVLDPDKFLDLASGQQEKLIKDGVVAMERQYSKETKPSVTVRL